MRPRRYAIIDNILDGIQGLPSQSIPSDKVLIGNIDGADIVDGTIEGKKLAGLNNHR